VAVIVVSNLCFSSPGRALLSIREDKAAANQIGSNVVHYKTVASALD
jgi:ABC-type branched-subunit amino acid transport system permease subunit